MKIAIATDHNGVDVKKEIIKYLTNINYEVLDLSESNSPVDDYPDFAIKLGETINQKKADMGILICGTGIGMSIAANKVKGIRCAHLNNTADAILSREHNNANVMAIGKNTPINEILKIVNIFITTKFSNETRHNRRINKITNYENGEYDI